MAKNKMIKLRLTLDVDYVPHGVSKASLKNLLYNLVHRGLGDGMLTCETDAEVDSWCNRVEEREA